MSTRPASSLSGHRHGHRGTSRHPAAAALEDAAPPAGPTRFIFVASIARKATEKDLALFLEQRCGMVRKLEFMYDRVTRNHKGMGYVEFENPASVEIALALSGAPFMGLPLEIKRGDVDKMLGRAPAQTAGVPASAAASVPPSAASNSREQGRYDHRRVPTQQGRSVDGSPGDHGRGSSSSNSSSSSRSGDEAAMQLRQQVPPAAAPVAGGRSAMDNVMKRHQVTQPAPPTTPHVDWSNLPPVLDIMHIRVLSSAVGPVCDVQICAPVAATDQSSPSESDISAVAMPQSARISFQRPQDAEAFCKVASSMNLFGYQTVAIPATAPKPAAASTAMAASPSEPPLSLSAPVPESVTLVEMECNGTAAVTDGENDGNIPPAPTSATAEEQVSNRESVHPGADEVDDHEPTERTVVCLGNMFQPSERRLPSLVPRIISASRAEFDRYGDVLSVVVDAGSSKGEVYVQYDTEESADAAQMCLNGRRFDGRLIRAWLVNRSKLEEVALRRTLEMERDLRRKDGRSVLPAREETHPSRKRMRESESLPSAGRRRDLSQPASMRAHADASSASGAGVTNITTTTTAAAATTTTTTMAVTVAATGVASGLNVPALDVIASPASASPPPPLRPPDNGSDDDVSVSARHVQGTDADSGAASTRASSSASPPPPERPTDADSD